MKFAELHDKIPYVTDGKLHSLEFYPYPNITLAMPGRHAFDTAPVGGDFVVMVDDEKQGWTKHQFTHTDLFRDVESRQIDSSTRLEDIMTSYLAVVRGADPDDFRYWRNVCGIDTNTFLRAVQCLAVAEHRRYAKHENKFGGRYLPFRFSAGIAAGLWTALEASGRQRRGRPGVEHLEKEFGRPYLTMRLVNA